MLAYISEENIPYDQIGTHLPLNSMHMANDVTYKRLDPAFANPDLNTNRYFLFSNIENKTKDDDIRTLRSDWTEVATFSQLGVFLTLYKSPER